MELGYWAIRGLAQPIRLLLEYTGTDYVDKRFECGPAPTFDKSEYFNWKNTVIDKYPLMNLPYLSDGDLMINESNAIMRYLARKYDLYGSSEEERVRADMIECVAYDFRNGAIRLFYSPIDRYNEAKSLYRKSLPSKLKKFSDFLADRPYFAGSKVTYVDFIIFELLDQHLVWDETCFEEFPLLKEFMSRMRALPKVETYLKSDRCITKPINNKMASFV